MNTSDRFRKFALCARRTGACVVTMVLLAGCPPTVQVTEPAIAPVRIVSSLEPGPTDPFDVTGHELSGDILRLEVRYSGGCETHEFVGLIGSAIAESLPVQMWGRVAHDDRDDPCDAIVPGSVSFDLSPVRELYQAGYATQNGTIILHLSPLAEPLTYTF